MMPGAIVSDLRRRVLASLDECHGRWGRDRFYLWLLGCCLLLGFVVFLIPGWPAGDDIYFHLYRMEQLAQAFRRFQFSLPVYGDAFDGYGYGVSLFYGDFFLYPPAALRALGLPLMICVKVYVLALTLVMGVSCYLCAWRLSRSCFAGFAAGLLTCWSSYVATDLFNRFAFGEWLAFVCFPLALWGYWEILWGKYWRWWLLTLGFAGLLLAHNLSLMMCLCLFGLLFLSQFKDWLRSPCRFCRLVLAAVTCVALTAFFWGPMLEQMVSQRLTFMDVSQGDISWRAMPWWRWVLAIPDLRSTGEGHVWCPPGVGLLLVVLSCRSLWLRLRGSSVPHGCNSLLAMGLFCCFMASELAPWKSLLSHCFLSSMQFPWRFFQGATCFLGIGCGIALGRELGGDWRRERRWLGVLIVWCGLVWCLNVGAGYWRGWELGMVREAAELRGLEVGVMHYFPSGLTDEMVFRRGEQVKLTGHIRKAILERPEPGVLSCAFVGDNGTLELPLVYYPGYEAQLEEGDHLVVFNSGSGLVSVRVPLGVPSGRIIVSYGWTLVRGFATFTSLITVLALIAHGLANARMNMAW